MIANFVVTLIISSRTPAPSKDIQDLVENIRKP
jgi:Na+(H+)/acetate symporter ActP